MNRTAFILIPLLLYSICMSAQTVSIADFGLKPDTRENAVPFVQKTCQPTLGS
jgi:hypothetical protein